MLLMWKLDKDIKGFIVHFISLIIMTAYNMLFLFPSLAPSALACPSHILFDILPNNKLLTSLEVSKSAIENITF